MALQDSISKDFGNNINKLNILVIIITNNKAGKILLALLS